MNEKPKIQVTVVLARCPQCGGSDLLHYGTRKNAQCETIRYYRCRAVDCGEKFPALVMNPDDDDGFKAPSPWRV